MSLDIAVRTGSLGASVAHATIAERGTGTHGRGVTHLPRGQKRTQELASPSFAESRGGELDRLHVVGTFPTGFGAGGNSHAPMMSANKFWGVDEQTKLQTKRPLAGFPIRAHHQA